MSRNIVTSVFIISIVLQIVFGQSLSKCFFQKTCVECLDTDISCAWCTDENYGMYKSRCMSLDDLKSSNCSESKIETNENSSQFEYIKNESPRDFDREALEVTQISPQKVWMKLGKLEPHSFKFTYKPAKNYPLDLYYLMDLTWSMKDDRDTLINMGDQLAKALANLTENYRLGFGSFIDKPIMPFIQTEEHRRENPCSSEREICGPTYGFRHRLQITKNIDSFIEKLKTSNVSANLDNLEGGLDALMQVLVCDDRIGWGANTRKIVILATNGYMHMAGDGLLAGITERNDKLCHLSADGEYTGALLYDYPSLEEIYRVLGKSKTAVIFGVTQELQEYYTSLQELMSEFASVGLLQDDSSNILQLVDTGYRDFVRRVEFTDNAPSYIRISYTTDCGGVYTTPQPINKCDNIEIGKEYDFNVEIRLLDYPPEQVSNLTVKIEETLISNEAVELVIDIRKTCNCELEQEPIPSSDVCMGNGDYSCGMCNCQAGWIGKTCECNLQNFDNSADLLNLCRAETEFDELGPVCSERGECICGQCHCNHGFDGPHCECSQCTPLSGLICNDHGECDCGTCKCHNGWSGDECDCSTDDRNCKAPHKGEFCSGRGDCICGKCSCSESYFGPYCEAMAGSESELCSFYDDCVRCAIHRKLGKKCDNIEAECKSKLGLYSAEFFETLEDTLNCTARITHNELTCDFKYTYSFNDQRTLLKILDQDCSRINVMATAFGIALLTVVLGLLVMVIIRMKMYLEDRRMYQQFEKEQQNETSYQMQSPLYKSPISNFTVPEEMADSELR
ncbi:integrin beta-nu [Toxorhynchites rutilus septentrionalis]|uniref:integrin beta-nu n=1 Tax=Toxorhynchites rutilus septentrionalis TaxID=329112 RepID=UPI00247A33C9|nr:integrin beta-nu [Toxorhynchites rutilus septentrionalis]